MIKRLKNGNSWLITSLSMELLKGMMMKKMRIKLIKQQNNNQSKVISELMINKKKVRMCKCPCSL